MRLEKKIEVLKKELNMIAMYNPNSPVLIRYQNFFTFLEFEKSRQKKHRMLDKALLDLEMSEDVY